MNLYPSRAKRIWSAVFWLALAGVFLFLLVRFPEEADTFIFLVGIVAVVTYILAKTTRMLKLSWAIGALLYPGLILFSGPSMLWQLALVYAAIYGIAGSSVGILIAKRHLEKEEGSSEQ